MIQTNWEKTFFTIWLGQAFSLLTSSIVQFAILWYLTDTTRSGAVLSIASLAAFLPQGLLGPFIGVFIDRSDRKKIMMISDGCIAGICLFIVILGIFYMLPIWLFLAVLFVRSIGAAFYSPALAAATPLIVPENQLTRCAGYSQTLQSVSLIISPALAAMLYTAWDLRCILFLDVFGALIGVGTLCICSIPKPQKSPKEKNKPSHMLREAFDGLAVLRSHKGLFGLMLIGALYIFTYTPVSALYPLMSMDYFGGTAAQASIAEITFSVGVLSGSLLLAKWGGFRNQMYSIVLSVVVMGFALIASAVLPPSGFVIFAVLSGVMGFTVPFYSGVSMALMQQKIESEYLGRVLSLSSSILVIAAPLGLTISGATADYIGVNRWFGLSGVAALLCALLCFLFPAVRTCAK